MSIFKIGDVVMCVNDDFSRVNSVFLHIYTFPVWGGIYTVRTSENGCIRLKEIVNKPAMHHSTEPEFFNWRFIKLIDAENLANEYVIEDELLPVEGRKWWLKKNLNND